MGRYRRIASLVLHSCECDDQGGPSARPLMSASGLSRALDCRGVQSKESFSAAATGLSSTPGEITEIPKLRRFFHALPPSPPKRTKRGLLNSTDSISLSAVTVWNRPLHNKPLPFAVEDALDVCESRQFVARETRNQRCLRRVRNLQRGFHGNHRDLPGLSSAA